MDESNFRSVQHNSNHRGLGAARRRGRVEVSEGRSRASCSQHHRRARHDEFRSRCAVTYLRVDVRPRISDALRRQGEEHAQNISVEAKGAVVTLKGRVPTFAERRAAESAAWLAPSVREVRDEILVGA